LYPACGGLRAAVFFRGYRSLLTPRRALMIRKTSQYFQSEIFIFFAIVTFGEQDSAQSKLV